MLSHPNQSETPEAPAMSNVFSAVSRRAAATAVLALGLLAPGIVLAAPTSVEIVAFAHPPVVQALQPLRTWLSTQGTQVKAVETDMESPAGAQRLQALGIKDHVPLVIVVNGSYRHKRSDGSPVELVGFPSTSGSTKGWTLDEAKDIITRAGTRR